MSGFFKGTDKVIPKCNYNGDKIYSACTASCDNKIINGNGTAAGTQTVTFTTKDDIKNCTFTPRIDTQDCTIPCPCSYSTIPTIYPGAKCDRLTATTLDPGNLIAAYKIEPNNNTTCNFYQQDEITKNIKIKKLKCNGNTYYSDGKQFLLNIESFNNYNNGNKMTENFDNNNNVKILQEDNKKFVNKLNDFNKLYYSYINKCNKEEYNNGVSICAIDNNPNGECAFNNYDSNCGIPNNVLNSKNNCALDCPSLYKHITEKTIVDLKTTYDNIKDLKFTKTSESDSNRNDIFFNYNHLNKQRNNLDIKLRELYNIPGYNSSNGIFEYHSTVYSGIIITIIASSLVYYAFTKL